MKKTVLSIAILSCAFLISTSILTSCGNKKGDQQEQKSEGKEEASDVAYACPMHPEVTGKDGDKCSKCGMKLEAVKKSDSTEEKHSH
jgi:hypothetical protein